MSDRKDLSENEMLCSSSLPDNERHSTSISTATTILENSNWCTNGGKRHDWKRWRSDFTPVAKYKCEREGCGFFKKCWLKCKDKDTTCNGCHIIGHQRWGWEKPQRQKK